MARKQWTRNDDKQFENALVQFPESYPYRFETIAYHLHMPLEDVMHYYEALVYDIGLIESVEYAIINYPDNSGGISSHTKHMDKDRKRGLPWTAAEHRSFLVGLAKCGRGDWKSIAREYVRSRTPTQVASHAQKYFLRQIGESKAKKRSSIHDTTSVDHVADNVTDPLSDFDFEFMMGQLHFGEQTPQGFSHSPDFLGR